jgi:hypothetical protein
MTAPLYLNHENNQKSLHVITNKILNAIDDDETGKLEAYINEAFQHNNVSQDFFWMLYCYAKEVQQSNSCLYLEQIIQTTYNF